MTGRDIWKDYSVTYPYQGSRWGLTIRAQSLEDAEARLKALGWGKIDGEIHMTIPASVGFWVPIYVWLRNLFRAAP